MTNTDSTKEDIIWPSATMRQQQVNLQDSWSAWIAESLAPGPDYFMTLTFRPPKLMEPGDSPSGWTVPGVQYVSRAADHAVTAMTAPAFGSKFFMVAEGGKQTGRLHLHVLFTGPSAVVDRLDRMWQIKYGFTYKMDCHRDAPHHRDDLLVLPRYLAKYLAKQQHSIQRPDGFWAGGF